MFKNLINFISELYIYNLYVCIIYVKLQTVKIMKYGFCL